jgi:peptidyl-prolyl cis-trans isomerase B (cyclophilin B)
MTLRRNRDRDGLLALQEELIALSKQRCKDLGEPKFTPQQCEVYTTLGGTPFLDGQYTVFGEVTEGLDVVERIQACETLRGDRPKQDVSMTFELVEA